MPLGLEQPVNKRFQYASPVSLLGHWTHSISLITLIKKICIKEMADPLSALGAAVGVTALIIQVTDECIKGSSHALPNLRD